MPRYATGHKSKAICVISGFEVPYGCYDPETSQGQQSGHWAQCTDSNKAFAGTTSVGSYTSSNTAYLDNFLNFANKFCKDCGISIPSPIAKNGNGEIKGGSIISVYNIYIMGRILFTWGIPCALRCRCWMIKLDL